MEAEPGLWSGEQAGLEARWQEAVRLAPRLQVADNLRRHFDVPIDIDPTASWIAHEANPEPGSVSIGIELEVWWSHILDDDLAVILTSGAWHGLTDAEKQTFNEQAEPVGYQHQARCQETVALGIPSRGRDGLWEFSHCPAWHHQTLVEEVSILVAAGLVPEEKNLPLHITLGGVAADANTKLLLRVLELAGNSQPQRLLKTDEYSGWSRRGNAGIATRAGWKLELNQPYGIELRTLTFQNINQQERLLNWAQQGGALIRKLQQEGKADKKWQKFIDDAASELGMTPDQATCIDPHVNPRAWTRHVQRVADSHHVEKAQSLLNYFVV